MYPQVTLDNSPSLPEQGHEHEAPSDDGIDGERALEPLGGVEGEMFGLALGLEHPE